MYTILKLNERFGPIITDEESEIIYKELEQHIENSKDKEIHIKLDFNNVIAMSTKSAKRIFGKLYFDLGEENFYKKIHIINASKVLQEIIYDSIVNYHNNNRG